MSKINEFLTEFADLLEKHGVCIEAEYEVGSMDEFDISQWFVIHNKEVSIDIDIDQWVDTVIDHNIVRKHITS